MTERPPELPEEYRMRVDVTAEELYLLLKAIDDVDSRPFFADLTEAQELIYGGLVARLWRLWEVVPGDDKEAATDSS
jgi:hypothetical protein